METSGFNLRRSVDEYVGAIKNQGTITGSDAAELTAHLYDAADALKTTGLSEEEAFIIASKRLGNRNMLTEEYSKVNPSIRTNKIWAYLLIGYNMFYKVPALIFLGIGFFYISIHERFGTSSASVVIVTLFHFLFIAGIWFLVKKKNSVSKFIEKQVDLNPVRIVCLSFIPFWFLFLAKPVFHIPVPELQEALVSYPVRTFRGLTEFSFYLAVLSIIGGVLSLIFSINIQGKLSLRSLFEKPSVWFLVLFGIFTELIAASTRAIRFPFDTQLINSEEGAMLVQGFFNKMAQAVSFGIIYLLGSFLITYYNKSGGVNRYLLIFLSFGFIMDTAAGISAGNSTTVYYASALLIGVFLGKVLGKKASHQGLILES